MGSLLVPTLKNSIICALASAVLLSRHFNFAVVTAFSISFSLFFTIWTVYRCFVFPYLLSPLRDIPTISGLPIFGNFFEITFSEFGVPQREWHREHGPIIRYIYGFGSERLSITDDEAVKQITVKDSYNFVKPQAVQNWMSSVLGRGVLLVDGPEHMRQRKALSPAFSTASIRNLTPVFWEKGILLTRLLLDQVKADSTPVEMLDWLNRGTLDVIGAAAFGYEINSLQEPDSPLRNAYSSIFAFDVVSQIVQTVNNLCSWSRYIPVKINRDMDSAIRIIKNTAAEIVRAKEDGAAHSASSRDIMALVAKQNSSYKEGDEDILSFDTLRDQIMTFLGAGHDTTATGIMWTLHLLAKNPDMQERLREEIRAAFPSLCSSSSSTTSSSSSSESSSGTFDDKSPEPDMDPGSDPDVDRLPYLNNVCRESLRYIPPIPLTIRENVRATTLCGHRIPAGTWMYVIANVMNRAPAFWGDGDDGDDADRFDPDRWERLPATYTANAFMTFLHGPRACIGRKFAETEMKVFLCCLLARFRFGCDADWPDPELNKRWRLVLKPRDGMHLRLSRV